MKLITIEGRMYKVPNKVYEEISEANINADYEKQNELMDKVEQTYKRIAFVNNFYFQ